jgi:hypothetical protein
MFQVYVLNVSSRFQTMFASVFIWMLHIFHIKCFQVFLQVFRTHVLSVSVVSYVCCKCFHLDVLKVDLVLQLVFQMHVSCVLFAFRRMLQVLYSDISKVD